MLYTRPSPLCAQVVGAKVIVLTVLLKFYPTSTNVMRFEKDNFSDIERSSWYGCLLFRFIIKSIKRDLKTRPIYDCRCDERLEPKDDESTCLAYTGRWVARGTGIPKDRDEVNLCCLIL
jgi:hypothetical protein